MNRLITEYTERVYVYEVRKRVLSNYTYKLEKIGIHESLSSSERQVIKEVRNKYNETGLKIKLIDERIVTYKVDKEDLIRFYKENGIRSEKS